MRGQILPLELLARLGTTPDIEAMRPLMNARQRTVADGRATRLFMRRVQQEQDQQKRQPDVEVPVYGDGTFEHRGIPAGYYDVIFAAIVLHGMDDGHSLQVTIARVELRDGETTELRRDLSRLVPGRLDGRVLVNGKPYAHESVSLFGDLQAGKNTNMRLTLDADGRFAAQLVPGSYRLWLPYRTTGTLLVTSLPGNNGYWRSRTEAVVTSGQVTEHTFAMRRVSARVRILTADGTPVPGLRVTMQTKSQPQGWISWTTDAGGWITIVPAPLDPFALLVAHPNPAVGLAAKLPSAARDAWLDTIRVPETGDEVRFERRLPPNWRR